MEQKTILIIDDNRDIIRMIADELKSHHINFNVINANNGLNGVRVAKQELPDLILMDWDMPIMDGLEAIRNLKDEPSTRDIPVIMATGKMTNSEDLQTALEAGAVDYVRKPVDFIELSARINTALRLKAQQLAINELLQREIDLKNRKLSTTSMLIVEKNSLLGQLHSKVTRLETSLNEISTDELRLQIKQLKRQISNDLDLDSSWDTFKMHFEEVNPHFFDRLTELSNELSHKDLKICAYIKLRMDNKEIARLLNITSGSSRTALYRLKRKLHIPEKENLREVIEQID